MCELKLVKDDANGSELTFIFEDFSEMTNFMYVALAATTETVKAIVTFPLDTPEKGENINITK